MEKGTRRVMLLLNIAGSESDGALRVCGLSGLGEGLLSNLDELGMVRVLGASLAGTMRRELGIRIQDVDDEAPMEYLTTKSPSVAGVCKVAGTSFAWFVDEFTERMLSDAKDVVTRWGGAWLPDGFVVLPCGTRADYSDDMTENGVEEAFVVLEEARAMGAGVKKARGRTGAVQAP